MFKDFWKKGTKMSSEKIGRPDVALGDKAKDRITGYTGIVVAITNWLNGCLRITLQPSELKDGSPIDNHTFDIEQLEVLESKAFYVKPKPTGGPHPNPERGKQEQKQRNCTKPWKPSPP